MDKRKKEWISCEWRSLHDEEFHALTKSTWNWNNKKHPDNDSNYFFGHFVLSNTITGGIDWSIELFGSNSSRGQLQLQVPFMKNTNERTHEEETERFESTVSITFVMIIN